MFNNYNHKRQLKKIQILNFPTKVWACVLKSVYIYIYKVI